MSLGLPQVGTSSQWFSQYETDITLILQRLIDNSSNQIDAKDIRDAIWTLYNRSPITSDSYSNNNPTTKEIGGWLKGMTFSGLTMAQIFDTLFYPYVKPLVNSYEAVIPKKQFGDNSTFDLTWNISIGSLPLTILSMSGPNSTTFSAATGIDPDMGTISLSGTYSSTPSIFEDNTFTFSINDTGNTPAEIAYTEIRFNHKIYAGDYDFTAIGSFDGSTSSITNAQTLIDSSLIIGLTYSSLEESLAMDEILSFGTNSNLIIAAPSLFDNNIEFGVYINNIFNNDFSLVQDNWNFTNESGYTTPYNVWVSNNTYQGSTLRINF